MIEKPFGHDLAARWSSNDAAPRGVRTSTRSSASTTTSPRRRSRTSSRCASPNAIFEPLWNRRYVDHVEITVAESLGVEHRGTFYEQAGALRDIVQNHVLQVLALVAMEPPASFAADAVRDEKVKVLRSIRPLDAGDRLPQVVVRGQYAAGEIDGEPVPGLPGRRGRRARQHDRDLPRAAPRGRQLAVGRGAVPHPHRQAAARSGSPRSRCTTSRCRSCRSRRARSTRSSRTRPCCASNPTEGIEVSFAAKVPGSPFRVRTVPLEFSYERFPERAPEAYERVLFDALQGDADAVHPRGRGRPGVADRAAAHRRVRGRHRAVALLPRRAPGARRGGGPALRRSRRPLEGAMSASPVESAGGGRRRPGVRRPRARRGAAVGRALRRWHRGGWLRAPRRRLDPTGRASTCTTATSGGCRSTIPTPTPGWCRRVLLATVPPGVAPSDVPGGPHDRGGRRGATAGCCATSDRSTSSTSASVPTVTPRRCSPAPRRSTRRRTGRRQR